MDCLWPQFRVLAGLDDSLDSLQVDSHHAIYWANEALELQRPCATGEKRVSHQHVSLLVFQYVHDVVRNSALVV